MNKNVTFDEYKAEVIRDFYKVSGMSEEDAAPFLNSNLAQKKIKTSYKYFTTTDVGGFDPRAVASCLDMLYE